MHFTAKSPRNPSDFVEKGDGSHPFLAPKFNHFFFSL